jgi:hypothetical protein
MPELPCPTCGLDQRRPVSAVPEDAYRAAWKVIMSGGTLQAALEAAAPLMAAGERARLAAVIPAARFRKLADWFDTDDEFKTTMFPETWPRRGHEVQGDLRKFADSLDEGVSEPGIREAERQRCAALLTTGTPMGFLRRHGLEPGAGTGQVLEAAAAEILAGGVDAPGRPRTGPSTARTVPGGTGRPTGGSEPAETATAP